MKKSVLKSVLAAIAVVMMSCTTTANAQTGNTKYIYGQNDTNTTVYTLNEDGKTLTRKLKYEYKHDENGQVIEKKAYRWDAYRELWKPAYLLTVTPGVYDFSVANSMVTNFHLPLSTLLMLVAAYGGYDLVMEAYHTALKEDYRFGTYGDAMLILDK